jgi:hypothetical protein
MSDKYPPQTSLSRGPYRYIDDTGKAWSIDCAHYLATAGGLEPSGGGWFPSNYRPRHIKLVALRDRPGMPKYRCDVVTNERDPSKLLNKTIMVQGREMRCIRYVGEQRRGR